MVWCAWLCRLCSFCVPPDEELLREEMKDLINDDVEEEEEEEEEDNKRKHESDEEDDVMDDEDYDLIEENLGIKVQRKVRDDLLADCFWLPAIQA